MSRLRTIGLALRIVAAALMAAIPSADFEKRLAALRQQKKISGDLFP